MVFPTEALSDDRMLFSGPGCCLTTDLLLMALEDQVLAEVSSLDDLRLLMEAVDKPVRLGYKDDPAIAMMPILRAYLPHSIDISKTKALTYHSLYFQLIGLGIRSGYEGTIHYCITNALPLTWPLRHQQIRSDRIV
jgi:hypothetical protein